MKTVVSAVFDEAEMWMRPTITSNVGIGEKLITPYWGYEKGIRLEIERTKSYHIMGVGIVSTSGVPFSIRNLTPSRMFRRSDVELFIRPGDTAVFADISRTDEDRAQIVRLRIAELQAFDRKRNVAVFILRDKWDYLGRNWRIVHYAKRWLKRQPKKLRRTMKQTLRGVLRYSKSL